MMCDNVIYFIVGVVIIFGMFASGVYALAKLALNEDKNDRI